MISAAKSSARTVTGGVAAPSFFSNETGGRTEQNISWHLFYFPAWFAGGLLCST
jgi:hypothetical protein